MALGRLLFGLFYRMGLTPWEAHALPGRLRELIEGPGAIPKVRVWPSGAAPATHRSTWWLDGGGLSLLLILLKSQ